MNGIQITGVAFEGDRLTISYIDLPTDVRVQGQVVMQRQVQLFMSHPDYNEDALRLHDRVVKVLRNALEDFEASEPYVPEEDDDEDDERGMGE